MNTLLIRLEAPLQAWGTRSRWGDRETSQEPSKSGVIGLLACALGWGRDRDNDIRALAWEVSFGVRVDLQGLVLRDYQTVSGGAMSAEGKIKVTQSTGEPETVLSPRLYISDASFLVAVRGAEATVSKLATALQDPVWPVYLGRKSCPPAVPPYAGGGDYPSLISALETTPRGPRASAGALRASVEVAPGFGIPRPDQIDVLSRRRYVQRHSQDMLVNPPFPDEES